MTAANNLTVSFSEGNYTTLSNNSKTSILNSTS